MRPDAEISTRPKQTVISLDRAPRSEWVEVLDVPCGRRASLSLGQMGVCVNERVRVLSTAPMGGPVLVDAGGTTVAIGRSLARRITVRLMGHTHSGDAT
ncbi:MAG: FeoA family protein [Terriglobales bacterium]